MNRTFKVVFSKVRGTMVVASEAAATPHKKAAKTVIAAAAALAMGTVMAQGWAEPDGIDQTSNHYTAIKDLTQGQYNYVQNGGKTGFVSISTEGDHVIEGKEIWVKATGSSDTQSYALHANGTGVELTNTGKIYIQADGDAKSWSQKGMMAGGGATVVNEGDIVAKNAYGMTVEKDVASHIENGVNGTITVLDQGAGIELGGQSDSTAVNNGKITVSDIAEGSFGYGVLIKADDGASTFTFTNNGEITAIGDDPATNTRVTAIDVQVGSGTSAEINLIEGSKIEGIVRIGANTNVILNAKGTDDSFDLQADKSANFNLNVTDDANLTLEDGNGASIDNVTIENGRLNASIWQADNKFTNVRVNEDGIFNIQDLNAGGDRDQEHNQEGVTPHDTLLLAFDSVYNLNGGELWVAGSNYQDKLKVGTAATSGTLNIASGSYTYSTLEVAKKGTVNVEGGELNVTNLAFSAGNENNEGKVTVGNKGSLNIAGTLTAGGVKDGSLVNNGTLKLNYSNFFKSSVGEDGTTNWSKTDNVALVSGTGVVDLVDVTGTYTLEALKDTQGQFNANDGDSLQIVFSNAELELVGNEDLTAKGTEGYVLGTVVGDATTGTFSVSKNTTLAGVNFGAATSASVSAATGKTLTLVGNDSGDVFAFGEDTQITNVTATNVQLGTDAASKGQVNVETLTVADTFNVVGNYTANEISVESAAQTSVAGALDVKTLSGEGTMNVADGGVLTAGQINANVTLTTNGMLVLGDVPVQDEPVVAHLAREVVSGQVNRIVKIGVEGEETGENILTTNRAAGEALKAAIADGQYGEGTESYNGIYVDKAISVGTNGQVVVGTFKNNTRTENIAIGKDVVTVIDMNAFSSGDVVFDASSVVFNNEGKAVLTNLYSEKTLKLISGTDKVEGNTSQVFKDSSTNVFLTASAVQNADGVGTDLVVEANENVTTDAGLKGALGGLLAEGANLDNQKVLAAIGDKNSGFVNEDGNALTAAGVQATKEYLTAPVTAGTYNVAYDAANVISDKLIQRNLEVKNGLGVWADVFYASNETDTLYGASGYSADIYGGMLGVDMAFGEGARVGAALSIGTGDADSEGSVFKYSSDADFWGLSLYAGKDVGGLTFTADMSYLWLDNDISGSVNGASASESLDSTVFTIGARADWAAYAGDVMQVVPHVGIRWANIDVDDYRGMSMDSMNVIEMPIGVTVKGNFETASGWTVTPAFDFTVAPQIGDTEVETIVGDVDVIDNVYNATIGVSAGNDTMRFGLDYKYGFGNEGRSNNTFNLKASYLF